MQNIKNICICVSTADCVPILIYDKENDVIAAIHAGWRGTVKRIAEKAVELMKENYNCDPKNMVAAIGPSIGPCCFEFGKEAEEFFDKKYLIEINIQVKQFQKKLVLQKMNLLH